MDQCIICREFFQVQLFSIYETISDIQIKYILYDLNFKFPFDEYNISSKICPECCCNLVELYNFREFCCGIFVYPEEQLNGNKCRICCIKTDEVQMLAKSTLINGALFGNADILRQICSYDFNTNCSNNLCTKCYHELIDHYIFYLKCTESIRFWTTYVLRTSNNFYRKTTSSKMKMNSSRVGNLVKRINKTECHICFKSFRGNYDLRVHLRVHTGEKPYKCEICFKSFTKSCNLSSHLKIHTGDKKLYKCEICAKSFTRSTDLKRHLTIHTGEKKYKCKICLKLFPRLDQLKYHLMGHSKEKPFKCELCSKSYTQSAGLKIHLRIHTGEKPYSCEICFQSFRLKCSLTEHLRKHTGEKPYMCEICSKSFAYASSLKTHLKLHGGEKCENT